MAVKLKTMATVYPNTNLTKEVQELSSKVEQTAKGFRFLVKGDGEETDFTITNEAIEAIAKDIKLSGDSITLDANTTIKDLVVGGLDNTDGTITVVDEKGNNCATINSSGIDIASGVIGDFHVSDGRLWAVWGDGYYRTELSPIAMTFTEDRDQLHCTSYGLDNLFFRAKNTHIAQYDTAEYSSHAIVFNQTNTGQVKYDSTGITFIDHDKQSYVHSYDNYLSIGHGTEIKLLADKVSIPYDSQLTIHKINETELSLTGKATIQDYGVVKQPTIMSINPATLSVRSNAINNVSAYAGYDPNTNVKWISGTMSCMVGGTAITQGWNTIGTLPDTTIRPTKTTPFVCQIINAKTVTYLETYYGNIGTDGQVSIYGHFSANAEFYIVIPTIYYQ